MSVPGQSTIIRRKKRRRRRRLPLFPFVFLAIAVVGAVFGVRWILSYRRILSRESLPAGYIVDAGTIKREYVNYYGKPETNGRVTERFREAVDAARKRNIAGATSVLETAVKEGALPAVFHDLGVGYAALGDFPRAADAFREVLARDPEYAPTRLYLHSSKSIFAGAAEPYGREQEPNNDQSTANLIAVRSAVGGELAGGNDTSDYFRVVAPAAPRDLITIELANNSPGFSPRLHVYDSDLRLLSWGDKTARPGDSLTITGGPPPNSTLYIAISAADSNGGLYLLSVTPQKAFDKFEPNDDILSSRHISIGEEVPANIMDVEDTDFFSFVGPRKGKVTIQLRNRSTTLIPAVTTLNNDHRNLGFAQDVRKAGQDVQYSIDVDKDLTYYVEISSQGGTSGAYTLRVE